MNRPYLVNFSAILSHKTLSIRANVTNSKTALHEVDKKNTAPIESIRLFSKERFRLKMVFWGDGQNLLIKKEFDSDNYGNFEIKMSGNVNEQKIVRIDIYETSTIQGLDLNLGSFLPLEITSPRKIIISDFDKTLVDTRYHTAKEMYYSLNRPVSYFPTVVKSLHLFKEYINQDFQPFILSASPHFYEVAIRNWLYQNGLYNAQIYLKDYRDFISVFDGRLTTKDLKKQGFYKLNQLVDIILMTDIPDELVLMGDGFESDPFIYLTLQQLMNPNNDPWKIWKGIKNHNIFKLTSKQDSYFLTKFYQLNSMAKKSHISKIVTYIRATQNNINELKNYPFEDSTKRTLNNDIIYYLNQEEIEGQKEQNNLY